MRKDTIMYPEDDSLVTNYDRSFIPREGPYDEDTSEAYGTSNRQIFNEVAEEESYDSNSDIVDQSQNDRENERDKRNILDDARNEIFEYYSKMNKKKGVISSQSTNKYKKVQVQEEETGVPRVQVNAGYENPKIQCEGGEICSGVLLKWVLTLYGSNEIIFW